MEKARALGTGDALLDYHAGMIASELGQSKRAEALFQHALALNPNFHLVYAGEAREMLGQLAGSGARTESAPSTAMREPTSGGNLQ